MASTNTANSQGLIGRLLSKIAILADGTQSNPLGQRTDPYGATFAQNSIPDNYALADEGSYFVASMTPGQSALAYALTTGFVATTAFVVVQNNDPLTNSGRNLHMKHLRFETSVAPASGTQAWFASVVDTGSRTPTANTSVPTSVNVNTASQASTSGANIWFPSAGSITVPAAVNAKNVVGNLLLRAQIPVVGDEYTIQFGGVDAVAGNLVTAAPAGASNIVKSHPPIVLAPQTFALFYLWFPSNASTAASFGAIDVGYVMR